MLSTNSFESEMIGMMGIKLDGMKDIHLLKNDLAQSINLENFWDLKNSL